MSIVSRYYIISRFGMRQKLEVRVKKRGERKRHRKREIVLFNSRKYKLKAKELISLLIKWLIRMLKSNPYTITR